MAWKTDEFGSSHEGMIGTLLEDGTEPKPIWFDAGSGASGARQINDWHVYDGQYGRSRAAHLRGSCSCGWRGMNRYQVIWDENEPHVPSESGPRDDWEHHIDEIESQAVPLTPEIDDLLELLEDKLMVLASDTPLAGIRAAATVERIAKRIGWQGAYAVFSYPDEPSWDEIGKALGLSEEAARSRIISYRPRVQGPQWAVGRL